MGWKIMRILLRFPGDSSLIFSPKAADLLWNSPYVLINRQQGVFYPGVTQRLRLSRTASLRHKQGEILFYCNLKNYCLLNWKLYEKYNQQVYIQICNFYSKTN